MHGQKETCFLLHIHQTGARTGAEKDLPSNNEQRMHVHVNSQACVGHENTLAVCTLNLSPQGMCKSYNYVNCMSGKPSKFTNTYK